MINPAADISVVLIVLNNVDNIDNCVGAILKQDVREVIVVEGGSTDGTIEKLKAYPVQLHVIGKTGLSHSRQFGVDKVTAPYVALVDSDNILDKDCLATLKKDLGNSEFVGIAAQKRAYNHENLYARFQEWMNSKKVNKPGKKLVIGTPSLYKTSILKEIRYDANVKMGDDTDLCYRLSLKGHYVGTGNGICYEKMMDNYKEFQAKSYLYGKADSEFFRKNPSRRHDIGTHAFRNYFLKMSFHAIADGKFRFLPLVAVYSWSRMAGLYFTLLKKKK